LDTADSQLRKVGVVDECFDVAPPPPSTGWAELSCGESRAKYNSGDSEYRSVVSVVRGFRSPRLSPTSSASLPTHSQRASLSQSTTAQMENGPVKFDMRLEWEDDYGRAHVRKPSRVSPTPSPKPSREKLFRSHSAMMALQAHEAMKQSFISRLMISPYSTGRIAWDALGIMAITWDVLMVPMQVFNPPVTTFTVFMNLFTQFFWTADIGCSFMTGYVDDGELQMHPLIVWCHYLKTWFPFDLFVVTLDWLIFISGTGLYEAAGVARLTKTVRILRILRIARLFRLAKLSSLRERFSDLLCLELNVHMSVLKFFLYIAVIMHFVGSAWYGLGTIGEENNWVEENEMSEADKDVLDRYMTSVHWAISQFGVGTEDRYQPQNVFERMYNVSILLFALLTFSSLVGGLTNIISRLQDSKKEKLTKFAKLRKFCGNRDIPRGLAARIQRYARHVSHTWDRKLHMEDVELCNALSEPMKAEIRYHLFEPFFRNSTIMGRLCMRVSTTMLKFTTVGAAISTKYIAEDDVLFSQGIPTEMIWCLEEGSMQYKWVRSAVSSMEDAFDSDSDNEPEGRESLLDVSVRDWISEVALWTAWVHVGELRAVSECRLLEVRVSAFAEIMKNNWEAWTICKTHARRYVEDLNGPNGSNITDIIKQNADGPNGPRQTMVFAVIQRQSAMIS